ncbi:DUF2742 domain-containing protein [Streptomyces sp. NPDC058255]|uniref:DUF2742 domain-containing protein n=1 Tax=Streptomyces sp. NPDC058255 TaxID=3346407 RepID=UPI0036E64848
MSLNAEMPRRQSGAFQESSVVAADATVAQRRRGWTARRLESPPVPDSWPKYGTQEWYDLDTRDPRKRLALFEAAESWRLHQLRQAEEEHLIDNDPDEWSRRNMADARAWAASTVRRLNIARTRTRAELDAAARPKPPHQLQATPGWPAIAIPGQPGKHLTYKRREAA